jgi:hypothetical protein
MSVNINFIQRKSFRERAWKSLNLFVGITTILNVSMIGALIAPQVANATIGTGLNGNICRDNQTINLDQWADSGNPAAWQNGNLNGSNSAYSEGNSVPFQLQLTGLESGKQYTVRVRYDFINSPQHAYDYLTTVDRSRTPSPLPAGSPSTTVIPADWIYPNRRKFQSLGWKLRNNFWTDCEC